MSPLPFLTIFWLCFINVCANGGDEDEFWAQFSDLTQLPTNPTGDDGILSNFHSNWSNPSRTMYDTDEWQSGGQPAAANSYQDKPTAVESATSSRVGYDPTRTVHDSEWKNGGQTSHVNWHDQNDVMFGDNPNPCAACNKSLMGKGSVKCPHCNKWYCVVHCKNGVRRKTTNFVCEQCQPNVDRILEQYRANWSDPDKTVHDASEFQNGKQPATYYDHTLQNVPSSAAEGQIKQHNPNEVMFGGNPDPCAACNKSLMRKGSVKCPCCNKWYCMIGCNKSRRTITKTEFVCDQCKSAGTIDRN